MEASECNHVPTKKNRSSREPESDRHANPKSTAKSATLHLKTFTIPLTSGCGSPIDSIRLTAASPRCTIGRSNRLSQFVFQDKRVSKRHCQILFDSIDSRLYVLDGFEETVARASLNGVFLNGIRIEAGKKVVISSGDVVRLACGRRGDCGLDIGFLVERIVVVQEEEEVGKGENGLDLGRGDCVARADWLFRCCKRVLDRDDPVSCTGMLGISDGVLSEAEAGRSSRRKLLVQESNPITNNVASGLVSGDEVDKRKGSTDQEQLLGLDLDMVRNLENKQPCQLVKRMVEMEGELLENPRGKQQSAGDSGEADPTGVEIENRDSKAQTSWFRDSDDALLVDILRQMESGGTSRLPPGKSFYLNNLKSLNGHHSGVTLPGLFYPVETLSRVFIATFTSDIPWFVESCEIPARLPVTIACHNAQRCWSSNPDCRMSVPYHDFPNLVVVYPQFPEAIAFGSDRAKRGVACHHPKLLLLFREQFVRVIITSANLMEKQWNSVTNTIWWQDFPQSASPDYYSLFPHLPDTAKMHQSDFAAHLAGLVATFVIDVPSQAYWVAELAKYDFRESQGHLVVSIPGIHSSTLFCPSDSRLPSFENHVSSLLMPGFLGSVDAFVVGLSHLFCNKADPNGLRLKKLVSIFSSCCATAYKVVLRRNKNVPADANAVSVFVPNQEELSDGGGVQLGFLPRDVARWVSPIWDSGFFNFSGYICPQEALEVALGNNTGKTVRLSLHVLQGPCFSEMSKMMQSEHVVALCALIASTQRYSGLWRLQEVIGQYRWPEQLETEFVYGSSSIGSSVSPQFLASFSAAIGKKGIHFPDSEESDPEWGRWSASQEAKNPSIKIIFPSINRVKNSSCGILPSKHILCLPEKTWQRLRPAGIFHDAVPHPDDRVGHPMHVKVAMRRFQSKMDASSFGWVYCGSHNFSAAAWGRIINSPGRRRNLSDETQSSTNDLRGPKLHVCNFEVGIVFLFPPPDRKERQDSANIDDIVLPFVMPPPKYKPCDKPATFQALREALVEQARQKSEPLPQDETLDEDEIEEMTVEEDVMVAIQDVAEEKEEDKAYAEELWSQSLFQRKMKMAEVEET